MGFSSHRHAVGGFCDWCEVHQISLETLHPVLVAAYIGSPRRKASPPTVRQHLAAIRMLFDWLVVDQSLPMNSPPRSEAQGM